ncbi:hypothetical protein HZS_4427 [Henneguya salminicola]|nr:hypothetical protein HZS_4427 [Henneguya salminicola]
MLPILIKDNNRSHFSIGQLYEHDTVNHSVNFVDARTVAPANTIEGRWNAVKMKISPCDRNNFYDEAGKLIENCLDDFLGEFLWKRLHSSDRWGGCLNSIKKYYLLLEIENNFYKVWLF